MESSSKDNQKPSRINTFNILRIVILSAIVALILYYAAMAIFGSSENNIMAPGPFGHTNSIEKQVG